MNRRKITNALMTGVFSVAGWVAIVFIFLIFLFTFKEAWPALDVKTLKAFFFSQPPVWQPTSPTTPCPAGLSTHSRKLLTSSSYGCATWNQSRRDSG